MAAPAQITHALLNAPHRIQGETEEDYDSFRSRIISDLAPATEIEFEFADDIAATFWRLRRMRQAEQQEWQKPEVDLRRMAIINTFISRMRRDISCGMRMLRDTQKQRMKLEKLQLPLAIAIRRADLATHRESNLEELGFETPLCVIDEHIARQDAVRRAESTLEKFGLARAA
jgi:hypothetical protein